MKKISILLLVIWMGVIFYFSSQPATISTTQSDKVIHALNKIPEDSLFDDILEKLYESKGASFIIRKSAHMIAFAVLGTLSFIMVYEYKRSIKISFIYGFFITFLFAISDEIHQLFVPGRAGMIKDVFIDSIGAIIGLGLIILIYKLFIKNKKCINRKI